MQVTKSKRLQRAEAKTKKRVKRAHDKAERKGEKVVATRTVGHGNPRGLTQTTTKENIYQREREKEYKGIVKEGKIRERDEKKAERKAKRKGKAPKGFGVTKTVKPPRGGKPAYSRTKKSRGSKVAKKCGKECRRKLMAAGGGGQQ